MGTVAISNGAASAAPPPIAAETSLAAVLSPSQVRTFQDCQARYWFKYGLGLEDPKNGNLALGIAVHDALAINFSQKIESKVDLPAPEVVGLFDLAWDAGKEDTIFREDEDPAAIAATGRGLVDLYMRDAARFIQPVAVEQEVEGTIGGVRVQGRLDVIEEGGRIRDFKTSSKRPTGVTMDQAFQLATYVQLEPRAKGRIQIDTLVKTKVPQLIRLDHTVGEQDLRATERLYPLAQEMMRGGYYMPNRSSMLCSRKNCSFWRACQNEFGGCIE